MLVTKLFKYFQETSPSLISNVKIVKESKEIPEVILICFPELVNQPTINKYKSLFLNMHNNDDGKEMLKIFNYEKWVDVE